MEEADRQTDRTGKRQEERASDLGSLVWIEAQSQPLGEKSSEGITTMTNKTWPLSTGNRRRGRRAELKNPGHKGVQTIYFGYMV